MSKNKTPFDTSVQVYTHCCLLYQVDEYKYCFLYPLGTVSYYYAALVISLEKYEMGYGNPHNSVPRVTGVR